MKFFSKPKASPPLYVQQQAIRAAVAAGIAMAAGATQDEIKRLTYITIGETNARPLLRAASKNRPINGVRYADVGMWQTNLVHAGGDLVATAKAMMAPGTGIVWALGLVRSGAVFHAEKGLQNPQTANELILREIADSVLQQVNYLLDSGGAPIDVTVLSVPA